MKKTLNKVSLEGIYLNTIKVIYEKSTVNIILNDVKLKTSSMIRNKGRMFTLTTLCNKVLEVLAVAIKQEKRNKRHILLRKWSAWVAHSIKCPALDLRSGLDLEVMSASPALDSTLGMEPTFKKQNKTTTTTKKPANEEVKLLLFADDMIQYIENPKDSTKKPLELILNLVKLQDTKLICRKLLHFYTLITK